MRTIVRGLWAAHHHLGRAAGRQQSGTARWQGCHFSRLTAVWQPLALQATAGTGAGQGLLVREQSTLPSRVPRPCRSGLLRWCRRPRSEPGSCQVTTVLVPGPPHSRGVQVSLPHSALLAAAIDRYPAGEGDCLQSGRFHLGASRFLALS